MKYRCVIFYEHFAREFESCLLISKYLEELGVETTVASAYFELWTEIAKKPIDVVMIPWAYDGNIINLMRNFRPNTMDGYYIVNLHQEQICHDIEGVFLPEGKARDVIHISWSTHFSKLLLKNGISEDSVLEHGNPRFDPINFRELISYRKQRELLAKRKKKLLFISSYGFSSLPGKLVKAYAAVNPPGKIEKMVRICTEAESQTLDIISLLAREYSSEMDFIYRPHPSQYNRSELKLFCGNNNMIYEDELPLRVLIDMADIVLMWRSTSVLECFHLNKKPYRLDLDVESIPDFDDIPIVRKLPSIGSHVELRALVGELLKFGISNNDDRLWDEAYREYKFHNDIQTKNTIVSKEIAKSIAQILKDKTGLGYFTSQRNECYTWIKATQFFAKQLLSKMNCLRFSAIYANQEKEWKSKHKNMPDVFFEKIPATSNGALFHN